MTPRLDERTLAYRPKGAAQAIGLSTSEIYNLLAQGRIRAKKHGTATLILRDELQRFLETLDDAS